MPYEIVELGISDQAIGCINLDALDKNSGLHRYWHKTLDTDARTTTVWLSEAERVYSYIKNKYPERNFEIRDV